MPDLAGSTSQNKVIWIKLMSFSLIRSQDIGGSKSSYNRLYLTWSWTLIRANDIFRERISTSTICPLKFLVLPFTLTLRPFLKNQGSFVHFGYSWNSEQSSNSLRSKASLLVQSPPTLRCYMRQKGLPFLL